MVTLLVDFYIRADHLVEAEALFREHVADGRRDRGNLAFDMFRVPDDATHFVSIERWATRADVDHHDAQPHHPVFLRKLQAIQAREKVVRFLDSFEVDS